MGSGSAVSGQQTEVSLWIAILWRKPANATASSKSAVSVREAEANAASNIRESGEPILKRPTSSSGSVGRPSSAKQLSASRSRPTTPNAGGVNRRPMTSKPSNGLLSEGLHAKKRKQDQWRIERENKRIQERLMQMATKRVKERGGAAAQLTRAGGPTDEDIAKIRREEAADRARGAAVIDEDAETLLKEFNALKAEVAEDEQECFRLRTQLGRISSQSKKFDLASKRMRDRLQGSAAPADENASGVRDSTDGLRTSFSAMRLAAKEQSTKMMDDHSLKSYAELAEVSCLRIEYNYL